MKYNVKKSAIVTSAITMALLSSTGDTPYGVEATKLEAKTSSTLA